MRGILGIIRDGCEGYMRGKGEGCLAIALEAIMGPCEARGGSHNAKQSVTGRLANII